MTLNRRVLQTAGCAALVVSALTAQEPPAPTGVSYAPDTYRDQSMSRESEAFQRFRREQGGDWVATWNLATGTPKAVYGTGMKVTNSPVERLSDARTIAQRVIGEHGDLLGTTGSQMQEVVGAKAGGTWVFVYDQYWNGLQVIEGRADVRIHESGVVSMLGGQTLRIPAGTSTTPALNLQAARLMAWQAFGLGPNVQSQANGQPIGPDELGDDRVVFWGDIHGSDRADVHLAWELHMDLGDGRIGRCYVDANTGEDLVFVNDRHECWGGACSHPSHAGSSPATSGGFSGGLHLMGCGEDCTDSHVPQIEVTLSAAEGDLPLVGSVQAWVNIGPTATSPVQLVPLQNFRLDFTGAGTVFTDAQGNFNLPSGLTAPVNVSAPLRGRHVAGISNDAGANLTLTGTLVPGTSTALTMLNPTPNEFDLASTNVYWAMDDVNEYMRGLLTPVPSQLNTLSAMSATVNINDSCNAFYTANTINFFTSGNGCNNSAHAGVIYHEWGHGMDAAFGGISQVDGLSEAWGDILATYRSGIPEVGPGFRTTGAPVRTANNSATYPRTSCGTSVHCQGQSFMGYAWDVRNALQAKLGTAQGIAKAEEIVITSVVADATNQPDAVREIFIADDDDGNLLNGTPNYDVLSAEAIARNLPFPEREFFTFAHTPLGDSTEPLVGRFVDLAVTPIFGSQLQQVEVVATTNRGTVRRRMLPGSGVNAWRSILPYEVSPNTVEYHFEATEAGGEVERFPVVGEYRYTIGMQSVFSEGFETGAAGWSSFQVATQNDWQLGTPTGKSGSSAGVPWTDPSTAFTGTGAYGNDFGIGNFNGAYQPNVQNYLRAPNINTTGLANLRLRFARWLTVEEGIYDQAEIRLNGQTIWSNPLNGNLLDTSWSIQEVPLPASANNRSNNTLEWWLTTDVGLNLGGWAIDDVEVFSFQQVPTPAVNLRLVQEQVAQGSTAQAIVTTNPNDPAFLIYGDTTGPTPIPGLGLPDLLVGGNVGILLADANTFGFVSFSLPIPTNPLLSNLVVHLQAVTLDPAGNLVVTNPVVGLIE